MKFLNFLSCLGVLCLTVSKVTCTEGQCCEEVGLKVPDKDCLLSWDDFTTHVDNVTWRAIYSASYKSNGLDRTVGKKLSVRWQILEDGSVRRVVAYWNDTSDACFYADNTFGGGSCINSGKLEAISDENPEWLTLNRADRFVSPNPEKFILFSLCNNDDRKCNGYCQQSYMHVLIKDQRVETDEQGRPVGDVILNEIPWCEIEQSLNRCFSLTMGDNSDNLSLLEWTWHGPDECRL